MRLKNELGVALNAVKKAAAICLKAGSGAESVQKDDRSPVTVADLGSQAAIILEILAAFPDDAVVAEEESNILRRDSALRQKVCDLVQDQMNISDPERILDAIDYGSRDTDFTGRFWTLDPIDGTKGFLRGNQYAVALALVENGSPVIGVLGCPNLSLDDKNPDMGKGCMVYAVSDQGAFVRSLDGGHETKISVDDITDAKLARFCESVEKAHASHEEHERISAEIGIEAPPYRIDSQAKYAAVSRGDASVYLRLPRSREYREKIWDHAAGAIIVAEAGGKVSDFSGNPLDFSAGRTLENNLGILATNGLLHEKAVAAIRKITGIA